MQPVPLPLRALVVEDSEDDANINVRMLERAGFAVQWERVDTPVDLKRALAGGPWDVVLADYHMPAFTGMDALLIVKATGLDVPFILVSGALGEEGAVAVLTAGASDYVMKGQLGRLGNVVGRELEKAAARRALRESEAALRHAQQMARIAHVVVGPGGTFERWSDNWHEIVGVAPARLPRSTRESLEHVHPEDRERFRATAIDAAQQRRTTPLDYRWLREDGGAIALRQTMEPMPAQGGAEPRWFVAIQDVSDQKQAEERIRRLNRVYAVLSGINGALVRIRDRQELFDEACRIAVEVGGFRFAWICAVDEANERLVPRASAGGNNYAGFLEGLAPRLDLSDAAPEGHGAAALAVRENRAVFVNDVAKSARLIRDKSLHESRGSRSVAVLPLAVGGRPVAALGLHSGEAGFFDEEEQRLLLELAGDIAFALDHMDKEERVRYLAYYDPLTGLANRALLLDRLAQQLAGAGHEGMRAALVLVNIGRFKAINDARGRQAGDSVLRQVAGRLMESAGDAGNVARVGGDQFAVIVPRLRRLESLVRRIEDAGRAVDGAPYTVDGAELRISTRAGVALYPEDGADADTLFRNAEAALKSAESGDRFVFYAPRMTARVGDQLRLENQMRLALEQGEFVLHYQPKYSLEPQRITGAEVLIRWDNPGGGLVPPMDFIPLLEETGLIAEVGRWALAQAVADHVAWRKRGLAAPRIAVNVSAVQLRRADFVASLKALLASAGADPGIDLEITETLLMSDLEENIAKLRVIRDMGVNIVVDDFGTGYSSLAYLARLPAAAVKIDRSFVHDMTVDPDAMTLVNTIVSLGHSLRLKVIAEGVETQAQADYLRVMRCDEVQGFLFGRPMPAAEFERLLAGPA